MAKLPQATVEAATTVLSTTSKQRPQYTTVRQTVRHSTGSNTRGQCKAQKTKKMLQRAADFLQQVFFTYRENTFYEPLSKIESTDKRVIMTFDNARVKVLSIDMYPFPEELCTDLDQKKAILSWRNAPNALWYTYKLAEFLLRDLNLQIRQVMTLVKPNTKRTKMKGMKQLCFHEETFFHKRKHFFLLVDAKGIEPVFIDLAGARFGFYESIFHVKEYFATRYDAFGFAAKLVQSDPLRMHDKTSHLRMRYSAAIYTFFRSDMDKYILDKGLNGKDLLCSLNATFEETKSAYVDAVGTAARAAVMRANRISPSIVLSTMMDYGKGGIEAHDGMHPMWS